MAYKLENLNNFGTGNLGDVVISDGATDKINSYARVVEVAENIIKLDADTVLEGKFEKFIAGNDILIHVSASPLETEKLGRYLVAKILLARENILTLDKNVSQIISVEEINNYYVQAVTFANFDCLTLNEGGIITPPNYNPFKYRGGILALKCFDTLKFNGGHISLADCGIPVTRKSILRPMTAQETEANGILDSAPQSGEENFITQERFLLNSGDGAVIIAAKNIVCNENSRIGNIQTHGVAFCRGAADSPFKPSNITNTGGSTILIASENIKNFTPNIIAKYRTKTNSLSDEGRGLARCYIAAKKILPHDEKLYSYDFISDETNLSKNSNIRNFGNGTFGDCINPARDLNNSAEILAMSDGNHRIKYKNKTIKGLAAMQKNTLILAESEGEFILTRILSDDGNFITSESSLPENSKEIISLPEFENFTLTGNFDKNFSIAVQNTCDLRGANIQAESFILANKLIVNENTKFNRKVRIIADKIISEANFEDTLQAEKNFIFCNEIF